MVGIQEQSTVTETTARSDDGVGGEGGCINHIPYTHCTIKLDMYVNNLHKLSVKLFLIYTFNLTRNKLNHNLIFSQKFFFFNYHKLCNSCKSNIYIIYWSNLSYDKKRILLTKSDLFS